MRGMRDNVQMSHKDHRVVAVIKRRGHEEESDKSTARKQSTGDEGWGRLRRSQTGAPEPRARRGRQQKQYTYRNPARKSRTRPYIIIIHSPHA
ncbi:hypothetical protein OH77DRAFT_555855 [Trametes cingulata]|nr:hypothetical protein OH77DRAFT_555855 [Trametes cingulata]